MEECKGWLFFDNTHTLTVFVPDRDEDQWQKAWQWGVLLENECRDEFVVQFAKRQSDGALMHGFYIEACAQEIQEWLDVHRGS